MLSMPMIPSSSELMGSIYLKHLVIKIYIKVVVLRKKKCAHSDMWSNACEETIRVRRLKIGHSTKFVDFMRSVRQIIRIIRLYVNTIISSIDPIIDLNQRGFPYHRIFESHYFVIFPEFQKLNSFPKYSVVISSTLAKLCVLSFWPCNHLNKHLTSTIQFPSFEFLNVGNSFTTNNHIYLFSMKFQCAQSDIISHARQDWFNLRITQTLQECLFWVYHNYKQVFSKPFRFNVNSFLLNYDLHAYRVLR